MMCVSRHIERLGASNEIGPAVHPGGADLGPRGDPVGACDFLEGTISAPIASERLGEVRCKNKK